jgi:hypothetical protein
MAKCLSERSRTIKILSTEETRQKDVLLAKKVLLHTHSPECIHACTLTPSTDTTPIKIKLKRFSLEQIPQVMRKKGWNTAAKLQDKWFNQAAFEASEDHQKGKEDYPYPDKNVDTDTITMKWLTSGEFPRVAVKMEELKRSLSSAKVFDSIRSTVKQRMKEKKLDLANKKDAIFTPWKDAGEKISQQYHREWHFQHVKIDAQPWEKAQRLERNPSSDTYTVADELYAALGTFSLNAAIAEIKITQDSSRRTLIRVTKIVIYARDTYDFVGPQYLGHWNEDGLKIIVTHLPEITHREEKKQIPLEDLNALYIDDFDGNPPPPDARWFCVRNQHYNEWRRKNPTKGHDMLVFSDAILLTEHELPGSMYMDLNKDTDIRGLIIPF